MSPNDDIPLDSSPRREGKLTWSEAVGKPYHRYLSQLPKWRTQNLLLRGGKEPPLALATTSNVHFCRLGQAGLNSRRNEHWQTFTTRYDVDDASDVGDEVSSIGALFDVHELDSFAVQLSEANSSPLRCKVIAVDNILPPVMEVLGSSLDMDPEVFACHAGEKWKSVTDMTMLLDGLPPPGRDDMLSIKQGRVRCKIPIPRTLYGSLDHGTDFREWCSLFNPFLQNPEDTVRLVTLNRFHHFASIVEHITLQVTVPVEDQWTGLLLIPPPVESLVATPKQSDTYPVNTLASQNAGIPAFKAFTESHTQLDPQPANAKGSGYFVQWSSHWPPSDQRRLHDPFDFIASVYESTWQMWDVHCQVLDSLVRQLGAFRQDAGIFDSDFDATGLHRSQRLKELVVRSQQMLSGTVNCIRAILLAQKESGCGLLEPGPESSARLKEGMAHLEQVYSRLEEHLPTVQHHVEVIIAKQQIELSKTQLMLSQQATAQADTVKRISVLAFIFIPVSTASGIFGMNLKELTPNPPIWVFATTAACLMVATLLAAGWEWVSAHVSQGASKVKRHWIVRLITSTFWHYVAEVDYGNER